MKNKLSIKGQIELAKEITIYNDGNRWLEYQRIAPAIMDAVKNAVNEEGWFNPVIMTHRQRKSCQRPLRQRMPPTTVRAKIYNRENRLVWCGRP